MSRETLTWLNQNTLIGFTAKRGNAWHYKASEQGGEPNHYDGAIPVEDVKRRLFSWSPVELPVYAPAVGDAANAPGLWSAMRVIGENMESLSLRAVPNRKQIARSDTGEILGIFSDDYQPHDYQEWLLMNVSRILDDTLSIGSAGLLRGGAQAWVSVEVPENITTPEGVTFRPNLMACTSFDGSLATTYKRTVTVVVCDNTLAIARGEQGQQYKVRHSSKSLNRIADVREALNIVHTMTDDFMAEVAELCRIDVNDKTFRKFLDVVKPIPADKGKGLTMALSYHDRMLNLWNNDNRVSPWKNTAYGVLAAVNTYAHHEGIVRNVSRAERNMSSAVKGDFDKLDRSTLDTLNKVLASV